MKKIIIFAAVLAIAMLTATQFECGMVYLFFGIAACFLGEYCKFASYEVNYKLVDYYHIKKDSRKMLLAHACMYCCTLLCAAAFGLLDGFDCTVETAVGNYNFEYETVHQSGNTWYALSIMLISRGIEQLLIENEIKKNIELLKSRKTPKAI